MKQHLISIILCYLFAGIVYGITSRMWLYAVGKEPTFSLWIAIPLTMIFWPLDVYADIKWIGVLPQDIAAILTLVLSLWWLKVRTFRGGAFEEKGCKKK